MSEGSGAGVLPEFSLWRLPALSRALFWIFVYQTQRQISIYPWPAARIIRERTSKTKIPMPKNIAAVVKPRVATANIPRS